MKKIKITRPVQTGIGSAAKTRVGNRRWIDNFLISILFSTILLTVGCSEEPFRATKMQKQGSASSHHLFSWNEGEYVGIDSDGDSSCDWASVGGDVETSFPSFQIIDGEVVVFGDISLGSLEDVKKYGGHIFGQIIIPPEGQSSEESQEQEELTNSKSLIIRDPRYSWPGGVIPYVLSEEIKNHEYNMKAIEESLFYINGGLGHDIPITLVPRTDEEDYVEFVLTDNPYISGMANLGRIGGKQHIWLSHHYAPVSTVIHEIGHTAGLYHEHQRPDRNQYVQIHCENVIPYLQSAFWIFPGETVGPYDYNSIMHYGPFASSQNGLPVITSKTEQNIVPFYYPYPDYPHFVQLIFSPGDIAGLKKFNLNLDSNFDLKSLSAKGGISSIDLSWTVGETDPDVQFWQFRVGNKGIDDESVINWKPWKKVFASDRLTRNHRVQGLTPVVEYFAQVRSCKREGDCSDAYLMTSATPKGCFFIPFGQNINGINNGKNQKQCIILLPTPIPLPRPDFPFIIPGRGLKPAAPIRGQ